MGEIRLRPVDFMFEKGDKKAQLWDKMAQDQFVGPKIKGNQGKSSPRAGIFFRNSSEELRSSVRKFDSLAPARSAVAGLWVRPHSFRRFPSGSIR